MKRPKLAPHCEYCGRLVWGKTCRCSKRPSIRKKVTAWFDMNEDGELTVDDLSIMAIGHHWMLIGGLFIFVGSLGNVFDYWSIDSDAFWAAAGLAAIMEYRDDVVRGRRK